MLSNQKKILFFENLIHSVIERIIRKELNTDCPYEDFVNVDERKETRLTFFTDADILKNTNEVFLMMKRKIIMKTTKI